MPPPVRLLSRVCVNRLLGIAAVNNNLSSAFTAESCPGRMTMVKMFYLQMED